ncbi:MAG: hypothetical protein LBB28_01655 [Synergistaceae bacterium]|jgi:hypothetical protein|nr:hypothetical protein [Synergistaceae bacterium]
MRRAVRLTAALLVLSLVAGSLSPGTLWAGGKNVMRPAERGKKHVDDEVMAIYKPAAEIGYKAAEAIIKVAGDAPDEKDIAVKVWPPLVLADGVVANFKKKIYDDYAAHVKKEKSDYAADHKAWTNNVYKDLSGGMDTLYKGLLDGGALSFSSGPDAAAMGFDAANPGYRGLGGNIAYLDDYKDMMSEWRKYSEAFIEANNSQIRETETLVKSVTSMRDETFSQSAYRKSMQARNQTNLFAGQEVSNLRLDIARQIDARTKVALTLQRTRTDRQAAFERSVGTWTQTTPSARF